ncbi:ABC transporter ATP-binding protein [Halolamina salifodinae]|uniref:ABC-2 type transport system ATP-binding protein n=1 Tax=Halolamina salifodinae TaxID=1202767 RepID=A0A8T4GWQ7_9EURY|nr:ABC transporter ATP-binding protein [Halolamina salifodinae]MBP1986890.1 ABC-2 type transport system ATP-binding protein [Halolamina salifodinae]
MATESPPAVDIDGLHKQFGDLTALRRIDLTVQRGEVFGFLGPNGAGKSTTIDCLLDYLRPTEGRVEVFGIDAQEESGRVRQRVGVLPDGYNTFTEYTAREHVEFAIESKDADDDPDALLDRVGLAGEEERVADDFSKGMTQRLMLAMALVGDPDLLVLDEPSTGLDPNGVRLMREIVREETERGATVFFSSHILDQVERVSDRVGILADGELVAVDSIEGLRGAGAVAELTVHCDPLPTDSVGAVEALPDVESAKIEEGRLITTCAGPAKVRVLDALRDAGATIQDFESDAGSLESVFAAYTDNGGDGGGTATTSDDAAAVPGVAE